MNMYKSARGESTQSRNVRASVNEDQQAPLLNWSEIAGGNIGHLGDC